MRFENVAINGTAVVIPPQAVTSAEIEQRLAPLYERLGLPEGRLELMTGIEKRHYWEGDILPSQAAAEAGKQLLDKVSVPKETIDLLIHCGFCRDRMEPATAAYVHDLLGLGPQCQIMDISNACLGFVNAMVMVGGLIESGQIRHALLVSGENGKPLLENTIRTLLKGDMNRQSVKPYFANLTIGAGAAAMLLSRKDLAPDASFSLMGGVVQTDSEANRLCQGDSAGGDGFEMQTHAEALLEAGIALAQRTWDDFEREMKWNRETPDAFVCHQVGKTHQRHLFDKLNLNRSRDFTTYEFMGNVGSVSVPFTFHKAVEAGVVDKDKRVALLGIGSGLSSVMLAVEGCDV